MAKRIYVVTRAVLEPAPAEGANVVKAPIPRLVRASTKSVAVAHVARQEYSAVVATQDTLVSLLGKKVKVEEAGDAEG